MQWNVWYKEKIEDIATFLINNKSDVICLQELSINNPDQSITNAVEYIAGVLGYDFAHQEISLEENDMKLANAIFSKHPIISSKSAWINEPTGTGHYDDEYRAYVEANINIDGELLCVATVHMSYTNAFEPTPRKLKETDELMTQISGKSGRYILTGDFNAVPDSEVINKITEKLVNVGPDTTYKTWTTKPFSYDGFDANALDWRLDYIFSTDDITILDSKILDTSLSDHLPILVSFEV